MNVARSTATREGCSEIVLRQIHGGTYAGPKEERATVHQLLDDLLVHLDNRGDNARQGVSLSMLIFSMSSLTFRNRSTLDDFRPWLVHAA